MVLFLRWLGQISKPCAWVTFRCHFGWLEEVSDIAEQTHTHLGMDTLWLAEFLWGQRREYPVGKGKFTTYAFCPYGRGIGMTLRINIMRAGAMQPEKRF